MNDEVRIAGHLIVTPRYIIDAPAFAEMIADAEERRRLDRKLGPLHGPWMPTEADRVRHHMLTQPFDWVTLGMLADYADLLERYDDNCGCI